ncbi:thiopeptide-type bacteriocin biosynthesis protein [Lentzea sp. BCCO 10_0856]|uniref:Thiopeptide-type bacteriocin biosynthesis protein n=1 Tax=Lentzea miocenica TaxID=3095431 RepID=A0ABU4TFH9_9PSEU|nr:thiopeptide-type bacteriocin biosynthesis protein [Lentzea sp. BCCO 10_0856]MDX8036931.1 thiopeptide-type bacteriocin biosynthesis protein [Lentzea sp. BCCO 10_0856]
MSTHRLAPRTAEAQGEDTLQFSNSSSTEHAILRVLNGTSLNEVAAAEQVGPADLADAVEVYRQAGRRALERQQASGWWQVYIQFADWSTSEQVAVDTIVPLLSQAEENGLISNWWFMRKFPCWRVRLNPSAGGQAMRDHLAVALDQAADDGRISRWWHGIYEAETAAFGGREGMATAHGLFCEDSRAIMRLIRDGDAGLGRRELSLLMCTTLMRAAGLEWYEQGDTWDRVGQERPLPEDVPLDKLTTMASSLKQLMVADTSPNGPLLSADGPLASAAGWADAFRQAGGALGEAARAGSLSRGLRDVLSYVVIFHWNRLGLPARTQSILAWAARTAILDLPARTTPSHAKDRLHAEAARPATSTSRTADDAQQRALARFPLVPLRRFRCPDLETNARNVHECADSCREPVTVEERINRACTVWNLSALIAADCGLPDLAADLCRQQFQIFRAASPISGVAVIPSLQPLVNLARLTRRAGDPEGAYRELEAIKQAVRGGGKVMIHGEPVDFNGLIIDCPSTVDRWLRDVMCDDGTRALAAAGQWAKAATHAEKYDDADTQLREARQTRIIAHVTSGQTGTALDMVENTVASETWEHAVAACLRGYALLKTQSLGPAEVIDLLNTVRRACEATDRPTALFRARLGLTALDLVLAAGSQARTLCTELVQDAERSADAFVAREVLAHADCRAWAMPAELTGLRALVDRAGLGAGRIPWPILTELVAATEVAKSVLAETLSTMTRSDVGNE